MSVYDAYSLCLQKFKNSKVTTCYEYDTIFVFQIVPVSYNSSEMPINRLFSVNKKSKEIKAFQPFHISLEEYLAGKEIKDFK